MFKDFFLIDLYISILSKSFFYNQKTFSECFISII